MKIIVVNTVEPFTESNSDRVGELLAKELKVRGYDTDILKIPFSFDYKKMLSQMTALRLYHLEEACDRLICINTPSYLIKHPQKYIWCMNTYTAAYDYFYGERKQVFECAEKASIYEYIIRADDTAFKEAKRIYAGSPLILEQLARVNGIKSEVIYPPFFCPESYHCDAHGDSSMYGSGNSKESIDRGSYESIKRSEFDWGNVIRRFTE